MKCEYLSSMSTMEIVIIILCSVILLGAIYNIVKIRRMKNAIQSIYDFCEQVALMIDKFNGDFTLQAVYIFKNYNDVSNYLDESIYNNPATSIAISLKHKNLTLRELGKSGREALQDDGDYIDQETLSQMFRRIERYKDKDRKQEDDQIPQ